MLYYRLSSIIHVAKYAQSMKHISLKNNIHIKKEVNVQSLAVELRASAMQSYLGLV